MEAELVPPSDCGLPQIIANAPPTGMKVVCIFEAMERTNIKKSGVSVRS